MRFHAPAIRILTATTAVRELNGVYAARQGRSRRTLPPARTSRSETSADARDRSGSEAAFDFSLGRAAVRADHPDDSHTGMYSATRARRRGHSRVLGLLRDFRDCTSFWRTRQRLRRFRRRARLKVGWIRSVEAY